METIKLGKTQYRIHDKETCLGYCPFHNPSRHKMVKWKMTIRASGLVERLCKHGIGHPDPDSLTYFEGLDVKYQYLAVHGCDGCCHGS